MATNTGKTVYVVLSKKEQFATKELPQELGSLKVLIVPEG